MFEDSEVLFPCPIFNLVCTNHFMLCLFVLRLMFIWRNLTKSQICDIIISIIITAQFWLHCMGSTMFGALVSGNMHARESIVSNSDTLHELL